MPYGVEIAPFQIKKRQFSFYLSKPDRREPCVLSVFHLYYRGFFSAATFCAEVLGSELLLTGFFWSSFLGVVLARFFSPRAFRLWIPKRCKGVHCVDLGESFPTSICLQNLASIQPRTSRLKLGGIRCLRIVDRIMFAIRRHTLDSELGDSVSHDALIIYHSVESSANGPTSPLKKDLNML